MSRLRPFLVALPLALAIGATSALAAPTCALGVPGCCTADPDCDDADLCTGAETCDTETGACLPGSALVCDDLDPCTDDGCDPVMGRCLTPPAADGTPCNDQDGCTQTDACAAGLRVGTNPLPCDDGATCTDDLCAAGLCVHLPVHAACVADDPCAMATCMPEDPAADAGGCVIAPGQPDGTTCTEDLDPCTRDRCVAGACAHEDVENRTACEPVRDPFRQALVLAAFASDLRVEIASLADVLHIRRVALLHQIDTVIGALEAAAAEMNGADPDADTARERAQGAFGPLKRLPRDATGLVRLLDLTAERDPVDPLEAEPLRRSADDLRRGVRELKRDVRRLRRALRSFVQ